MTSSSDSTQPPETRRGLFRASPHVHAIPLGSVLTVVDLEYGAYYATTPFGAETWTALVDGKEVGGGVSDGGWGDPSDDEGPTGRARVADFLLQRRLIEPLWPGDFGAG
jgi:hypothetical protein